MENQVTAVSRSCYHQISRIGTIRQYITEECCKILVHSLVTSRLDYANSLLYGIPQSMLGRLQRVQNCAARLITRKRKHDHITPTLKSLHWLPVHLRCQYKILMLTFKALQQTAPSYLQELIVRYTPSRSLRSESASLLAVPTARTEMYGNRCLDKSASTLWNRLPEELRKTLTVNTFRKGLKAFLCDIAYPQ